jgi:hypothetical protein
VKRKCGDLFADRHLEHFLKFFPGFLFAPHSVIIPLCTDRWQKGESRKGKKKKTNKIKKLEKYETINSEIFVRT